MSEHSLTRLMQDQFESMASSGLQLSTGTKVGNYTIVRHLGAGGMGSVFLAQHSTMKSRFSAIKFLKLATDDEELRERFHAEILAMEKLKHENIIYAFDAGKFQGHDYLVMELVEGSDLSALVKKSGAMSVGAAAELIRQAANGLQHASEIGLVHRDIKPSNMMLSYSCELKILDLGLASNQVEPSELTVDSQVLGTPDYMAPEQWQNTRTVDIRADIYSLGCTLYFLVVGKAPFQDQSHTTMATKMHGHMNEDVDLEVLQSKSIDSNFIALLQKMLAKNPADRFQTPAELSRAITTYCQPEELSSYTGAIERFDADAESTRLDKALLDTSQVIHSTTQQTGSKSETSKVEFNLGRFRSSVLITVSLVVLIGVSIGFLLFSESIIGFGANGLALNDSEKNSDDSRKENKPNSGKTSQRITTKDDSKVHDLSLKELVGQEKKGAFDSEAVFESKAAFPIQVRYLSRKYSNLPHDDPSQIHYDEGIVGEDVVIADLNEYVKIEVTLKKPQYSFLLALNPTNDPEFRVQLLSPDTDEVAPIQQQEFQFPATQYEFYEMTDGAGQQGFLLITSDEPLPEFKKWTQEHLAGFPWKQFDAPGIWRYQNGVGLESIIAKRPTRGGTSSSTKIAPMIACESFLESKTFDPYLFSFPVSKRIGQFSTTGANEAEKRQQLRKILRGLIDVTTSKENFTNELEDYLSLAAGEDTTGMTDQWKGLQTKAKAKSEETQTTIRLLNETESEFVEKEYESYKEMLKILKEKRSLYEAFSYEREKNETVKAMSEFLGRMNTANDRLVELTQRLTELEKKILKLLE